MNKEDPKNSASSTKNTEVISTLNAPTAEASNETDEDVQKQEQATEDNTTKKYLMSKQRTETGIDKEPVFVLVDSSALSTPNSNELLAANTNAFSDNVLRKYFNEYIKPNKPSTSRDLAVTPQVTVESVSREEVQMVDIDLQSDEEILVPVDSDHENESIVLAYLRNRDVVIELEATLLASKKMSSILDSVPKMETINEGEQFSAFPPSISELSPNKELSKEDDKYSEDSLDVHIPSYPGSPRSLASITSEESILSLRVNPNLKAAVEFLHRDNEFLNAAEVGNCEALETILRTTTNLQQKDHLGRTALHLSVCSDSIRATVLLLKAGVEPNVKDNLGMTPLSLCLMRRPSLKVANLLFDHGAKLIPRSDPMDTGLFIQFVMMCTPTLVEASILKLLVNKGALINDPNAPGGRQPLHFAAMSNNCKLIKILVDLGADLFPLNHRNETPRDVAVTFKCRAAQELLESYEEIVEIRSVSTSVH